MEVKKYLHHEQISKSAMGTLKKMQAMQELSIRVVAYYNI